MTRLLPPALSVAALTAALLVVPVGAQAKPQSAVDSFTVTGECTFDVRFDVTGTYNVIEHGDTVIYTAPASKVRLTNLETGRSIVVSLAGALKERTAPDGSVTGVGTGHNLFLSASTDGLPYTTGRVTYSYDPATGATALGGGTGRAVDLCDRLA